MWFTNKKLLSEIAYLKEQTAEYENIKQELKEEMLYFFIK